MVEFTICWTRKRFFRAYLRIVNSQKKKLEHGKDKSSGYLNFRTNLVSAQRSLSDCITVRGIWSSEPMLTVYLFIARSTKPSKGKQVVCLAAILEPNGQKHPTGWSQII